MISDAAGQHPEVPGATKAMTRDRITEEIEHWIGAHHGGSRQDKSQLRALITTALELDYVSESCRGGIQTGNHYQSVRLGDTRTAGFRTDREQLLDRIDFRGRTVLDLGSNLGELSRAARERGAARVLGVEYDEFFVAIARAVTLLNDIEEVEFRQGDIADPDVYVEHFDIVLAFSVFQYVGGVIDHVCRVTDELLVVETHKLEENLESHYVGPVARHLRSFDLLGRSDWGSTLREPGERAVIAFASDDAALRRALSPGGGEPTDKPAIARIRLDVRRTSLGLMERFFTRFAFDSLDDLLQEIRSSPIDVSAVATDEDVRSGYRGWLYWRIYLEGYLEYLDRGIVDAQNSFCRYLADNHLPQVQEPGISADDVATIALRRYRDLDAMRMSPSFPGSSGGNLAPIRITVSDPPPADPLMVVLDTQETVEAWLVDGWHRVFAAAICGIPQLEADLVHEAYPRVPGRIEDYAITDDGTLRLRGWCVNPDMPWQFMELRAGGRPLARVAPSHRSDVASAFPHARHAATSGFSFTCPAPSDDLLTLDLVPMREWLAIGRMRLHRTVEPRGDLRQLALATGVGEALAALGTVVPTHGAVLAIGSTAGEVASAWLPENVVVVGADPAEWDAQAESVGMIVGGDALAAVPDDERTEWLDAAGRALRPGGVMILRDRGWFPAVIPARLRHFTRLPAEPVEASETVVLLRL